MQALDLASPSGPTPWKLDLPQAERHRVNDNGRVVRAAGSEIELVPIDPPN